jgi:hypothetical protein
MAVSVNLVLQDHVVPPETQQRRDWLVEKWDNFPIFDCTLSAAEIMLLHKNIERNSLKDHVRVGKTVFFWDRANPYILHCLVEEANGRDQRTFAILSDGRLHYDGEIYESPKNYLEVLIDRNHTVYSNAINESKTALASVVNHSFSNECIMSFPPAFPPLLVSLAIENRDFATALKILQHPYITDALLPNGEKYRLKHVLGAAIESSLRTNQLELADYFIETNRLIDPLGLADTSLMATALLQGRRAYAQKLFSQYDTELLPAAAGNALVAAASTRSPQLIDWTIDLLLQKDLNLVIAKAIHPTFPAEFYAIAGRDNFERVYKRFSFPVDWTSFIEKLLPWPPKPLEYLEVYINAGNELKLLPLDLRAKLLEKVAEQKDLTAIQPVFEKYPELKEALDRSLLFAVQKASGRESLAANKAIRLLIAAGAQPNKDDFEAILQYSDIGALRKNIFELLLEGINSLEEAKSQLSIASSFGEEAIVSVINKFPALAEDPGFIKDLAKSTWKGALLAAEKLASDLVKIGGSTPAKSSERISNADRIDQISTSNAAITIEILNEIWLPKGKIDKIAATLRQTPTYIVEFWHRALFATQVDFALPEWQELASSTFQILETKDQEELLKYAFYFFNRPLARLWMTCFKNISGDLVIECFRQSIRYGDPEVVELFVDLAFLSTVDKDGQSLLHIATQENSWTFIEKLLLRGANLDLTNKEGSKAVDIAWQGAKLSAFRLLYGKGWIEAAADKLPLNPTELRDWLLKAFLNSSSQDLLALMKHFQARIGSDSDLSSALTDFDEFIRRPGTLITRFPSPKDQQEFFGGYGKGQKSYETQQQAWAEQCEGLYHRFYEEFCKLGHGMLKSLIEFAKPRSGQKGFEAWRIGYDQGYELHTHFHGRYFLFWRIVRGIYQELLADPNRFTGELELTELGYKVIYSNEQFPKFVLSNIDLKGPYPKGGFKALMRHTSVADLKGHLPYVSRLFDEIKEFPCDPAATEMPPELKEKIALFYWLGCHNTLTDRGNSQYMLMMHRLLYNIHGFQAAPWSPVYVLPDCIAIAMPFRLFYTEYYDKLFDFPIQPVAKH